MTTKSGCFSAPVSCLPVGNPFELFTPSSSFVLLILSRRDTVSNAMNYLTYNDDCIFRRTDKVGAEANKVEANKGDANMK